MNFGDTLNLSFRNLRQAKMRTALTTLGVSIGIASLTGMVSLGVGLQDQVVGRFLQSGVFDNITVTNPSQLGELFGGRGARGGLRGRGRAGNRGTDRSSQAPPLDDAALKQISELQNVRDAYPELRIPVEMKLGDFSQPIVAAGVPMSAKNEGAFQTITHGEFFPNDHEEICMLSLNMAETINEKPASLIGQSLTLSYSANRGTSTPNERLPDPFASFQIQRVDRSCRIVGIVERDASGFPGAGPGGGLSGLMIPLPMAKIMNAEVVTNAQALVRASQQTKTYNSLTVKVKDPQSTLDVQDQIRKLGYTVFSISDALRGAKNAFIILDIVLGLIGSIALTVSSLGIVNTMVMSILERTREIGIMKAVGAGNADIRRIFLIEASVIGLAGGLLGTALGWIVGQLINFGANVYIRSQGGTSGTLFLLPLWLMGLAIAFSMLVSLIAGSYPASRAARLDPIQALRHD
jgi:putative ABC transport system permease protein